MAQVRARATGAVAAVRGLDRPLALLAGMAFVVQIGVAVMLPLLPLYAQQFGATPFVLGLLTSAHAVMSAVGQLTGGFLTERFASRRLVAAGIGLYAGANILIATATAALPLIVFRGLAGLGGGVNQVAERIYLTEVTDRARRAFSNGILSAAGAAGSVLGPAVGGLLVVVSDLRVPFLVVGATSALATIGALFLPRPRAKVEVSDVPPDVSEVPPTEGDPGPAQIMAPGAVKAEIGPEPDPGRRPIIALFLAQLALNAAFGAFITTYAIYATGSLGWSAVEVGVVFSMFGLGSVILGPWLARQADRTGRRRMAVLGCIPVVCFGLVFAAGAPQPLVYAAAIAGGGGLTGFEASWFALLATATDEGRRGRVFGTVTALTNLGVVVGALGAARIWEQVDIQVAVTLTALGFGLAGLAMLLHPVDRPAALAPVGA
jgi:DHA1 family tetracycline resistance protein-like MFS transporter